MKNDKFLITFPIPTRESKLLCQTMEKIAKLTKIPPPFERMDPHVTLRKPLTGIAEEVLRDVLRNVALQNTPARFRVSGLDYFGKQHIIVTVQPTLDLMMLPVTLSLELEKLAGYKRSEYDGDNVLHVTVAEKIYTVFDSVWPKARKFKIPEMDIVASEINLWVKREHGNRYQMIGAYPFSKE